MNPWDRFEVGWVRFQKASEAYKAPIFSGGSYVTPERYVPREDTWLRLTDPSRQVSSLPWNLNVFGVSWPEPAADVWIKVAKGYDELKSRYPGAIWDPNNASWEQLLYVPVPSQHEERKGPVDTESHGSPLDEARARAQADRQRELDWANTAYAHHEMDTETWIRTINEIEAKYRGHV
jgi:hypothetical protein